MLPINVNLPLKSVTDRIRSCLAVLWAVETHGRRLVEILGESFDALLEEGATMPFEVQLALFKKRLIEVRDRLVNTDRAYRDQKAVEAVVRAQRDAEINEVNTETVGLRQSFTGIYREDKLAEIGFARRTPQTPGELLEQASHLVVRLEDPDLDLTGSNYGDDCRLDAPHLVIKLADSVRSLRKTDEDLAREARMTEALKLAKDDALDEFNTSFLWIARTVESLCRLAGLNEVAKRVRPSSRRPGVTARKFEDPGEAPSETLAENGEPEADAANETTSQAAA